MLEISIQSIIPIRQLNPTELNNYGINLCINYRSLSYPTEAF